jgi:hypothetical protein
MSNQKLSAEAVTVAFEKGSYEDLLPLLSPYSREFLSLELGRGLGSYIDRIEFIGLKSVGKVLDAGGGARPVGFCACSVK